MDSETLTTAAPAQAAPWGRCFLCGRVILSAFVPLPVVRGRGVLLMARAHTSCVGLAGRGLAGDDLAAATAELAATHDQVEALYRRMVEAGARASQAVTP